MSANTLLLCPHLMQSPFTTHDIDAPIIATPFPNKNETRLGGFPVVDQISLNWAQGQAVRSVSLRLMNRSTSVN